MTALAQKTSPSGGTEDDALPASAQATRPARETGDAALLALAQKTSPSGGTEDDAPPALLSFPAPLSPCGATDSRP